MTITLELTAGRQARLLQEFRDAIAATSRHDLEAWGGRTVDLCTKVAIRRGKNFGSLVSRVWDFLTDESRGLLAALRRNGALPHLRARGTAATERAQALGDVTVLYETFVSNLKDRPADTAFKVAVGVLGFLVGSGGVDGDGGIPDLDLVGGMGAHRSILTHSVISGIFVEALVFSILDLSKTIYRNLPEEHDRLWEDLNAASDDLCVALTKGVSVGIAYHLGVDATVDGDGTYKGIPVPISAEGHQFILAANALTESIDASAKRTSEPTINETEEKMFKTFREATDFAKQKRGWVIVRATDSQGFRVLQKLPQGAKPNLATRSTATRKSGAGSKRTLVVPQQF